MNAESTSTALPYGRIAGIDFGTVRIGIAITDPEHTIASPLETYTRKDKRQDAKRFRELVEEERIVQFVVGLPIHLSGQESQKSAEARGFAAWLGEVTDRPVKLFDERFTTAQANELMGQAELTSSRRKARRDMLAAQILLAAYLEASAANRRREDPGPLDDDE